MAPGDATLPATRRTRRSIGAHTDVNKAFGKENATTDVTSSLAANRKKSRSKSLGPGGLDALMKTNGNRRAVRHDSCYLLFNSMQYTNKLSPLPPLREPRVQFLNQQCQFPRYPP
jgi:kinetochore protein Spc7/SPC105